MWYFAYIDKILILYIYYFKFIQIKYIIENIVIIILLVTEHCIGGME